MNNNRGLPPGSGAVRLMLCGDPHSYFQHSGRHLFAPLCVSHPPCAQIGVRFPADDPDPGRFYRSETRELIREAKS